MKAKAMQQSYDTTVWWLFLVLFCCMGVIYTVLLIRWCYRRWWKGMLGEIAAITDGNTCSASLDTQETPTRPLPIVQPQWERQFDAIMQRGLDEWKKVEFDQ